jgi:alpha-amylase
MIPRAMIWANYRRNHVGMDTIAVPAPVDGGQNVPWWYDKIAMLANEWARCGFTDVLFPNPVMGESGSFNTGDGYNPFDDYDIGSKGKPTRFGTADLFRRAVAICHANGLNVLLDNVVHQRMGGRAGVYRYRSATGKDNGRFPKDPPCFRGNPPRVPEDPVPSPPDDYPFGDQLCPVNAHPYHYVWDGLIAASDWLFRTSDADGARLDDMKGMNVGFMMSYMNSGAMKKKWFFGEYASGNRNDTNWWVDQVRGRSSALDFDFHYNMVMPMCMDAGSGNFFMGHLAGRGMIGNNPMKAVPFVESMDSDTNGFATVIFNKTLGYALMFGGEGLPMAYVRDYLQEPDCYGLGKEIQNLAWIHARLSNGFTVPRCTWDARVYVFERVGEPGLLMALNNDVWNTQWKQVRVATVFPSGTQLHDYTGHNQNDVWVQADGHVTLYVPPGADGKGYSAWSTTGLGGELPIRPRSTRQVFFGDVDLDIGPLTTATNLVGRVWCAENTALDLMLHVKKAPDGATATLAVTDPGGNIKQETLSLSSPQSMKVAVSKTGWHSLALLANVPGPLPFELDVTYMATKHLHPEELNQ